MTLVQADVLPHDDAPEPGATAAIAAEEAAEELAEAMVWLVGEGLGGDPPSGQVDQVDLDEWFDKRLAALGAIERQIERNTEFARRRINTIRTWMEDQNVPLERRAGFLRSLLEQAARGYPYGRKARSRKLPHGEFGSRTQPPQLELVDEVAALAWAESKGLTEAIHKSVRIRVLQDYWRSSGEVPDGCRVVPAAKKWYVKAYAGGE